jgi:plasmid stabilization system protein ParE
MAYRLSPAAERDLDDITYYIAKESGSLAIADRLIDAITSRFYLLAARRLSSSARTRTQKSVI